MKKPGLVIALGMGKPKAGGGDPEESGESYKDDEGAESAAAGELADILGVPPDKMDAFKDALSSYVSLCMQK